MIIMTSSMRQPDRILLLLSLSGFPPSFAKFALDYRIPDGCATRAVQLVIDKRLIRDLGGACSMILTYYLLYLESISKLRVYKVYFSSP